MGRGMGQLCGFGSTTATFKTRHHLWVSTIQCLSLHPIWGVCPRWIQFPLSGGPHTTRKEISEMKDGTVLIGRPMVWLMLIALAPILLFARKMLPKETSKST